MPNINCTQLINDPPVEPEEDVNDLVCPDSQDTILPQNYVSTSRKTRKEWFYFGSEHIESKTHCHGLSIRTHEKKFVLVPIIGTHHWAINNSAT